MMLYTETEFLQNRWWKIWKNQGKAEGFQCQFWCVKLKQLPFSLMYLLFRQNDCLYCKCGILWPITILHKRICIQVKRPIMTVVISGLSWLLLYLVYHDCCYIWFIMTVVISGLSWLWLYLVYFCGIMRAARSINFYFPPVPAWMGC